VYSDQPDVAEGVFNEARELRETIFRIFSAPAEGRDPPAQDLGALNEFLSRSMAAAALEKKGDTFVLSFGGGEGPDRMLAPVVWSAVQLLTSPDMRRVKVCSGDTCGWLFVDASKNKSRRWCEMSDCGNRAKARRHYQKIKEKAGLEPEK
jgi:predicted RNA-binding Zn ribbon-like protein